eukprot:8425484-Pyramimonas_sp.AAC.1
MPRPSLELVVLRRRVIVHARLRRLREVGAAEAVVRQVDMIAPAALERCEAVSDAVRDFRGELDRPKE